MQRVIEMYGTRLSEEERGPCQWEEPSRRLSILAVEPGGGGDKWPFALGSEPVMAWHPGLSLVFLTGKMKGLIPSRKLPRANRQRGSQLEEPQIE